MIKFILALITLATLKTQAFTLITTNPNQKGWASNEITFLVNPTNCPIDVVSLISDAAAVWNNVANSNVKVSYGGATAGTSFSNPTTVYCETNFNPIADDDFVPGAASVQTSNGTIVQGIMYLNASAGDGNIANFPREILTIIIAHEIGHILGLGHSADQNALMYYDASYRESLSLGQDDIDGVSYLYPSNELSGDKILGCGSLASVIKRPPSQPSSRNLIMLALLLLIPLLLTVGLRNRRTTS